MRSQVIRSDNFNREGPGYDDYLIIYGVEESLGDQITDLLNQAEGPFSQYHYHNEPLSYELQKFEP